MAILKELNERKDWPKTHEDYNNLAILALEQGWTWNGRCDTCNYAILKSPDGKTEFCRHQLKRIQ